MNKIFYTSALLLASHGAWADNLTESLQQTREQFSELQQQNQQQWISQHRYQAKAQPEAHADLSRHCLPYQKIRFVGVNLIDSQPLAPQAGECLNEARLNQLSKALTAAYLEKGYVHNPLQFEDDGSGDLILHVFEGKLAKIEGAEDLAIGNILPVNLGEPLRIYDLDQALDQANRVTGNQVSVDVLPAKNGEIALVFDNQKRARVKGSLGVDNYASKTYDRWQGKGTLAVGNPLGFSDNLYLSLSHTLNSRQQFNRSALLYYSLPYGYWTFNSFVSVSQFKAALPLQNVTLWQKGRTVQAGLSADWVLHRGSNHISTLSWQMERIDSKNRLAGEVLELQSPKITSVSMGLNHLQLFENASLIADLRFERSKNTAANPLERYFSRWNAELKFDRYQPIGKQVFRHSHQLTAQYSNNYLPSVKQEDLTSRYRVRGLNDFSRSAEKNVVLHNNLAWVKAFDGLTLSPYVGVDFGVQKSTMEDSHSEKAFSYVLGVNLEQAKWRVNLEWATGRLFSQIDGVKQQRLWLLSAAYQF